MTAEFKTSYLESSSAHNLSPSTPTPSPALQMHDKQTQTSLRQAAGWRERWQSIDETSRSIMASYGKKDYEGSVALLFALCEDASWSLHFVQWGLRPAVMFECCKFCGLLEAIAEAARQLGLQCADWTQTKYPVGARVKPNECPGCYRMVSVERIDARPTTQKQLGDMMGYVQSGRVDLNAWIQAAAGADRVFRVDWELDDSRSTHKFILWDERIRADSLRSARAQVRPYQQEWRRRLRKLLGPSVPRFTAVVREMDPYMTKLCSCWWCHLPVGLSTSIKQ